jgi:signal recognition particle subunit SRP54
MVLEGLGSSLRYTLRKIVNASHIDKNLIKEVVRDIQRALLQADVNVKLALELTREVERRALSEKPPAGMSSREHVIKIIGEELVNILGEPKAIKLQKQTIMMVGLYGQGKTTTAGKLARYLQKKGLSVGLVATDIHRPAAYDQLSQIAKSINVPIYGDPDEKKASKIVKQALKKLKGVDVIIIDTSGRHSLESDLIDEIKEVAKIAKPDESILVLDSTIGQQAGPQAKAFHDAVGINGIIFTKLDGTAKGGGALSAVSEIGASVIFIGTGEHLDDLEKFEPQRFVSRLLGMGDIQTLLEKAQEVMDEGKAEETAKKMLSGRFNLKDMRDQMEMLTQMGPLKKLMGMIPGFPADLSQDDLTETQKRLKTFEVIMDSMTNEELENPKLIKSSRISRISRGSGTDAKDVRTLLKQYNMSKKAIKGLAGNRKMRRKLMKQLQAGDFGA